MAIWMQTARAPVIAAFLLLPQCLPAQAQSDVWRAEKCRLYIRAWEMAAPGVPLSENFVEAHDAFLASGCSIRGDVCPRSEAEKRLADMLTLMIVTEGATGSFLPFRCGPAT